MIYVGIDNGVSGSMGMISEDNRPLYFKMPVNEYLDYTKKEKWIHRIDVNKLYQFLSIDFVEQKENVKIFLERPMINPMVFNASLSAVRALEATLIVLEKLKVSYQYIDSREWQKEMLPAARKTKVTKKGKTIQVIDNKKVKKISLEVGKRLFPMVDFTGFKDADGLLIAEYTRKNKR
jgi:hypothetical protein